MHRKHTYTAANKWTKRFVTTRDLQAMVDPEESIVDLFLVQQQLLLHFAATLEDDGHSAFLECAEYR